MMKYRLWCTLVLVFGLISWDLSYGARYHRHQGNWGQNVIIVNPAIPFGGYYNDYTPYYYYPQYRCVVVPRCYPSGDCNYQNQECSYY